MVPEIERYTVWVSRNQETVVPKQFQVRLCSIRNANLIAFRNISVSPNVESIVFYKFPGCVIIQIMVKLVSIWCHGSWNLLLLRAEISARNFIVGNQQFLKTEIELWYRFSNLA